MTGTRIAVLVLVAATLGMIGYMTADAQPAGAGSSSGVAVVDVKYVFDNIREKSKIQGDLQAEGDKVRAEHTERKKAIELLKADIDVLPKGSDARKAKLAELERQSIDLQAWVMYKTQELNRQRSLETERIYKKMAETVGKMSQERGIDIVLMKEQELRIPQNAKPEQAAALMEIRKVLYASNDIDLTMPLVQRMNAEFNN